MHRVLLRNALTILPGGRQTTNVLIEGGKIAAIDAPNTLAVSEIVEGRGLVLFPGAIDDQVHFREPGLTHKEDLTSGSQACAAGGITTYLEMPNTKPSATTCERLEAKYRRAAEVSRVHYGFYIGASTDNLSELKAAAQLPGTVPGIKIFIGSSTGDLLVDDQEALERIFGETALPICAHCEDESTVRANLASLGPKLTIEDHSRIRDTRAAVLATTRALELAVRHQHRFHVLHVSTADEIPLVHAGQPWITSEVCLHHVFFSDDDYATLGTRVQMNPSLKTRQDARQLWQALLDGSIQVVATDHAPHTLEEKARPYPESPSGLPAVENSLALMLDQAHQGHCTYEQIAHWMSDAPARVWGLVGKGRIEVGYDADLVLVDPELSKTIRDEQQWTKSKWSPWSGRSLQGWPVRTWVAGQTAYHDGHVADRPLGSRVFCDPGLGGFWKSTNGTGPRSASGVG
jgi:dihydroorotase